MPFDKELPEWKKDNPDAKPAQSKLDAGFLAGEKPPASIWNWFANRTYQAIKQLFENAIHKEEKGVSNGVATLGADGKVPFDQIAASDNYGVATGTNDYVVTIPTVKTLADGLPVSVKFPAANTGPATLKINGLAAKPILKAKGQQLVAGNLAVSIYNLRYSATANGGTGSFILQGEGGDYGTATEADVLAPKTIGTENGVKTGTIPTYTTDTAGNAVNGALTPGRVYIKPPKGYWNDSAFTYFDDPDFAPSNFLADKNVFGLQGSIPIRGSEEFPGWRRLELATRGGDPGRAHFTIPNGAYLTTQVDGKMGVFMDDPNFVPSNIIAGKNVLGLSGTGTPGSAFTATPGDLVLVESSGERTHNTTTFTKVKEIQVNFKGTIRVKFDFRSTTNSNVEAAVYKNGVRVGTVRLVWVSSEVTFSEDFAVSEGDYMQLFIRAQSAGANAAIRNFKICVAQDPLSTIILA